MTRISMTFGATMCDASTNWGVRSERFELSLDGT